MFGQIGRLGRSNALLEHQRATRRAQPQRPYIFDGLAGQTKVERVKLDARDPRPDEASRLKFQTPSTLSPQDDKIEIVLDPYGVELLFFRKL